METGRVVAVHQRIKKGVHVCMNEPARFIKDFGLDGDSHGGKDERQVCLFGLESKEKEKTAVGLCTSRFNETITVEGVRLYTWPLGTRFYVGESIQEITQVGKKCLGCDIADEGGGCVLAKEVVFTKVLKSGWVKCGDRIAALEAMT